MAIKNGKPESVVEFQIKTWAKQMGLHINKIESKAVFSKATNCYMPSETDEGFSDLVATDNTGRAYFFECKSPDKFGEVRAAQYDFLAAKINHDCLAIVVDSRKRIEEYWTTWNAIPDRASRMKYLWDLLQTKKIIKKETKPKKIKVRY